MCYQIVPEESTFTGARVFVRNQLGPEALNLTAMESLCVPSMKDPP
jgi:hypothetical protein